MGSVGLALKLFRAIWEAHYRIPEFAYWLIGIGTGGVVALVAGLLPPYGLAAAAVLLGIASQGIVRWRIAKRRSRGAVVIPRFRCTDGLKAAEVQQTILASLQDSLTEKEMKAVHSIPAVVGGADRDFAARLCKRLRAFMVLQGDIRENKDGSWSVYARTCAKLDPIVTHIDGHTRDVTPSKGDWKWGFTRLTGVDEIPQREYPLEFATEIGAVVQGTGGQLAVAFEDYKRGERLLHQAISTAPTSTSAQIDLLRVDRAKALLALGKEGDALRFLRRRADQGTASTELLQFLGGYLLEPRHPKAEHRVDEAVRVLRQAAADRSDPRRSLTLYNLSDALRRSSRKRDHEESAELIREISESSVRRTRITGHFVEQIDDRT